LLLVLVWRDCGSLVSASAGMMTGDCSPVPCYSFGGWDNGGVQTFFARGLAGHHGLDLALAVRGCRAAVLWQTRSVLILLPPPCRCVCFFFPLETTRRTQARTRGAERRRRLREVATISPGVFLCSFQRWWCVLSASQKHEYGRIRNLGHCVRYGWIGG